MHMNYLTEVLVLSVVRNARSFRHIAVLRLQVLREAAVTATITDAFIVGSMGHCIVHRHSVCLLLVRKPGRLLFTFRFMQPAIRVVRMLRCMRCVALASKASMTVTLK